MLQHVLDLTELAELKPTEIVGLHLKVWVPYYPALVEGEAGEFVQGMSYEVQCPPDTVRRRHLEG